MNLFTSNVFYVVTCDSTTIYRTFCLTLDLIDSCKELAKQGHHVVLKKARIRE